MFACNISSIYLRHQGNFGNFQNLGIVAIFNLPASSRQLWQLLESGIVAIFNLPTSSRQLWQHLESGHSSTKISTIYVIQAAFRIPSAETHSGCKQNIKAPLCVLIWFNDFGYDDSCSNDVGSGCLFSFPPHAGHCRSSVWLKRTNGQQDQV